MEYQQLVIFVLAFICAGAACKRIVAARSVFKAIDTLLVWVLFPAMVFNAIVKNPPPAIQSPIILAIFGLAASAVLSALVITRARVAKKTGAVVALNSCFMNYGYLGFPLVTLLLGMGGLAIAAIYGVIVGIFHLTIGTAFAVSVSGRKVNPRLVAGELLAFPPVVVMIVALMLVVFGGPGFRFPDPVHPALDQLTYPSFVCMLLIIGYNLKFIDPREYSKELLTTGAVRFMACPLVTYLGAGLVGAEPLTVKTTLILSAMPPAMFNIVLAKNFKLDMKLSGAMIVYPTLVSFFVVTPLFVFFVFPLI